MTAQESEEKDVVKEERETEIKTDRELMSSALV